MYHILMPYNVIIHNLHLPFTIFMSQIVLYFLQSISVISSYIDVILTLFFIILSYCLLYKFQTWQRDDRLCTIRKSHQKKKRKLCIWINPSYKVVLLFWVPYPRTIHQSIRRQNWYTPSQMSLAWHLCIHVIISLYANKRAGILWFRDCVHRMASRA